MDVEKVARLPACGVLLYSLVQLMADARAAVRTVLGRTLFCIVKSIVTGSITYRTCCFM